MRTRSVFLAASLAFLAVGAQAQALPAGQRVATEPEASVFVYERLGATPSIRLPLRQRNEPSSAASQKRTDAVSRAGDDVSAPTPAHVPPPTRAAATITR